MSFRKFSCVYWARRFTTVTTKVYYLTVSQPFETTNVTHYLNVQLQPCTSFPRKTSAYISYLHRYKMHEILWEKRQRPPTFSDIKTVHNLKKDTVVPIHDTQAQGGSEGVPPLILNIGTKGGWVVDLTPRPLYRRGKSSQYLLNRSWVGRKAGLGVLENWWNLLLPGFEPQITQLVAQSLQWTTVFRLQ